MLRPVITPLTGDLKHKGRPGLGLFCNTERLDTIGSLGRRPFLNLADLLKFLGNRW